MGQETLIYEPVFVPPEGIQVEKSLQTEKAGQLHAQVVPAHKGADGHMGGGWSYVAPLNLATINPLSGPHINTKGYHVSRDGNLQGLRNGQRGVSCASAPPQPLVPGLLDQHFQTPGGMAWIQSQW